MKYDKKIQRSQAVYHIRQDDDDIVRNMTNLILNKERKAEASFLELETASHTHMSRALYPKQFSKKLPGKEASLFLNPQVESFLSIANNTTNLNATANFPEQINQPFLDQSLFNDIEPLNEQPFEVSAIQSASASKVKMPFADFQAQKRSSAFHSKLQGPVNHFKEVAKTRVLEEETPLPDKHIVVKRFMDLLFLNGTGDVSLRQEHPLAFSDIEVRLH